MIQKYNSSCHPHMWGWGSYIEEANSAMCTLSAISTLAISNPITFGQVLI